MTGTIELAQITAAISGLNSSNEARDIWVSPARSGKRRQKNQLVFFFKPELLALSSQGSFRSILEIVFEAFANYKVEIGAVRALNGVFLKNHRIMDAHYGVINKISRYGDEGLTEDLKEKLIEEIGGKEIRIIGGHQFIQLYYEMTPWALNVLSDSVGTRKLAPGVYYIPAVVSGVHTIVLNPFHPYQLQHFTESGSAILVFECWSDTAWRVLRQEMTGATSPSKAMPGSIRRTLLNRQSELGLKEVSQGANGVHLSAGPLEGMIEYRRFFEDVKQESQIRISDTNLGQALIKRGLSIADLEQLSENPVLMQNGHAVSAFDKTEELDTDDAAELLSKT